MYRNIKSISHMKTTYLLILLMFAFASCRKCAKCTSTIVTTQKGRSQPISTTTTTFDACGKDLRNADGSRTTSTSKSGNIEVTADVVTNCGNEWTEYGF
jgi:uncharacterized lipoprotein YajG